MTKDKVDRSDIEAALWQWSGWKADQRSVDALLTLIDQYAAVAAAGAEPDPRGAGHWQADLTPLSVATLPLRGFTDADGELWLCMGSIPERPVPAERTRKCSQCGAVKEFVRYRPDPRSRGGRKGVCRDCENTRRRAKEAEKRQRQ